MHSACGTEVSSSSLTTRGLSLTSQRRCVVLHFLALPDSVLIVCFQLWVCADGTVSKFKGDVQAYKVTYNPIGVCGHCLPCAEPHRQQHQSKAVRCSVIELHIKRRSSYVRSCKSVCIMLLYYSVAQGLDTPLCAHLSFYAPPQSLGSR